MSTTLIDDLATVIETRGFRTMFETQLEEHVRDTAAILDEHVPDWHERIERKLQMDSVYSCVLGQVFGRDGDINSTRMHDCGWMHGTVFLLERGIIPASFVFSAQEAAPYWEAEIEKRRAA